MTPPLPVSAGRFSRSAPADLPGVTSPPADPTRLTSRRLRSVEAELADLLQTTADAVGEPTGRLPRRGLPTAGGDAGQDRRHGGTAGG